MGKGPQDYIEVKDRLVLFFEAYPEGSIQGDYKLTEVNGEQTYIYTAKAYRHPADERPGVGHAAEVVPGRSPFTRFSELENAGTSATGRALVSLGIAAHKGVASAQDVRKAQLENKDFKQLPPAGVPNGSVVSPDTGTSAASLTASQKRQVMGMATERALLDGQLMLMMCAAADKPAPKIESEAAAADWLSKALPRFPQARFAALVGLIKAESIVEA